MRLYSAPQNTTDKIGQLLLVPAGLRASATPRTRFTSHMRWTLCFSLLVAATVYAAKLQEENERLTDLALKLDDDLDYVITGESRLAA